MSLGLPSHLASRVVNAGIALGAHVVAAVVLGASAVALLLAAVHHPVALHLVVAAAIALTGAALLVLQRRPTLVSATIYVGIGALAVTVAIVFSAAWPAPLASAGAFVVTALQIAVIMVGGFGGGVTRSVLITATGFVAGVLATVVGSALTDQRFMMGPLPALAALLVVVIYVVTGSSRRSARETQPSFQRAARDEKIAEVRSGVEVRAAALLHDTILGSLAAVTAAQPGPLPQSLSLRIRADLDAIVGQDWSERVATSDGGVAEGPVGDALGEAEVVGLEVQVTGDGGQLSRLADEVAQVLALAVRQLLVNVRQHSGVDGAEVVLFGDDSTVSVMVVDSGQGFDPDAVAPDRFGLRHSVRGRVESVGGSVRIWSTPGTGTSVLLTVPSSDAVSRNVPDRHTMEDVR